MNYSKEAHDLLNEALELLIAKAHHPYPRMVGYLMPNVDLETAKRIFEMVSEWEGDK
jgi:hypothetical protein